MIEKNSKSERVLKPRSGLGASTISNRLYASIGIIFGFFLKKKFETFIFKIKKLLVLVLEECIVY